MTGKASATVQLGAHPRHPLRHEPGDRIPWHRHEYDYLVVPLTDGEFEVAAAGETSLQRGRAGESYQRNAGAEHELINGERPYSFIEIEFTQPRSR